MLKLKQTAAVAVSAVIGCFSASLQAASLVDDLKAAAVKSEGAVTIVESSPYATGGDLILKVGEEYVHVFASAAEPSAFAVKAGSKDLLGRILLVGGGGGAGKSAKNGAWVFYTAGGGGGGGVLEEANVGLYPGQSYAVTVGKGGAGSTNTGKPGATGEPSSLTGEDWSYSALGGGGGGSASEAGRNGLSGATGGGAAGIPAVLGLPGNGSSFGGAGGAATVAGKVQVLGGGGGGAGGAGAAGAATGVSGGPGHETDIFGFARTLGGGGAGASHSENGAKTYKRSGQAGGGSSSSNSYGKRSDNYCEAGADGYGGGGAGSWDTGSGMFSDGGKPCWANENGARGGSGAVVIRYAVAAKPLCRHAWQSTGVTQKRACEQDGTEGFTCSKCSQTKTVTTTAFGHDYSAAKEDGNKYCSRCDKMEPCAVCTWGEPVEKPLATCVADGLKTYTCTRCGFTETNVIEATGHRFTDYRCTACGATENASQLVADLRAELVAMKGVKEVDDSPYAQGGDCVLKFADNEYLHVFSDAKEAKSFKVNGKYLLGRTLLVGGGGGAGANAKKGPWDFFCAGGGGGGGVKEDDDVWFYADQSYTVTVGKGGAGAGSTAAPGKVGEASSLVGSHVNLSVLGGGGGGSASADPAISSGTSDGATGGGASGIIPNLGVQGGAARLGNPGVGPASKGGAAGFEVFKGFDGDADHATKIMGGGGGGAGGDGAVGKYVNGKGGYVSGGAGVAVGIFGTEVRLAGGGAGGTRADNSTSPYATNLGRDGGGSNFQGGNSKECWSRAGRSGYGGGGSAGYQSGGTHEVAGRAGGSGLVAIRYRMIGSTPADPLVSFVKCEAVSETSVRLAYRVRNFGDGSTGAAVIAHWGLVPFGAKEVATWTDTSLATSVPVGQDGSFQLDGLAPGRFYTFKVFARNTSSKTGWAEDVYTIQMPGGRSQWGEPRAAQRSDALHTVDFTAAIASVGENTTTVTFRWKQDGDTDWSEEPLGTFTRGNPPPQAYRLTKTFLAYKPVSYEFVAENAAENPHMEWKEVAAGRIGITGGKISESYWATKVLNVRPELVESRTKVQGGRKVNYYTHEQDPAWGDNYTGRDTFKLCLPKDGDNAGRPLVVGLHGRGGNCDGWAGADGVYNAPDDAYAVFFDNDRGEGNNRDHSFPYWWGATSTHRGPELTGIASYRTERPTAKRVLDCVEWIVREKKIDRNRIYIVGNSMGGQGALAIGLPHGEVFAAIEANVPATIWYASARMNFVDDLGYLRKPGDRDGTVYNDPPPVLDWSGSDDVWSRNHEILFEAMNAFRYSYTALWGNYGHCGSYAAAQKKNDMVGKWNWRWIEKNRAYPVFCNATDGNQVPAWPWATVAYGVNAWACNDIMQIGGGTTVTYAPDATLAGQRNAFLRWENVSDDESGVSVNLWIADAADAGTKQFTPPASTKVDVTMRRIQGFALVPGQTCSWKFGAESGTVTADAEGLATVNVTLTQERQLFTLAPGAIDAFRISSEIMETTENAISVIVDVTSLGKGASSAAIALDYKETGAAAWATKNFKVAKAGAAAYEIAGLEPGKAYDVKVAVNNGKETKDFTFDAVETKCHPLVASAVLGPVETDALNVDVTVDQVGTFAKKAVVRAEIRGPKDTDWVVRELGTVTEAQAARYRIGGLLAGARYAVVVKVENDCAADKDVTADLGTVATAYAGDRRLVELPLVNDLVFTGSAQAPTVAASDDYTVKENKGGTAVGKYGLTLTLTKPRETRWEGTESADCVVDYRIVQSIAGLHVPDSGVETYTRNGDVFLVFREGEGAAFTLDYDARADILLIGGGGPGGMAGDYFTVRPGAGGGAGGFVEKSGVALVGGMPYKVTVGKGGEVRDSHRAVNNAGGKTTLEGGLLSLVAYGGGGGGHASTGVDQRSAAMGRKGASSGGSLHYSATWGTSGVKGDGSHSIAFEAWKKYFVGGQGHQGGRVSGTTPAKMKCISAGGGGAGGACADIPSKDDDNRFEPGGAGRVSSITGVPVMYAGGGAGGVWAEDGAAAANAGGDGGGGSAAVAADGTFAAADGADGFGGGGAGASCHGATLGTAGRGGDGVLIVRLLGYAGSDCAHADTKVEIPAVEPTCEKTGMTAKVVCNACRKVLSSCAEIAPLGHDFSNREKVTVTLGNGKEWTYTRTHCARPGCGVESRFSKIQHLKWSKDRRHVMLNAHRGLVSEKLRIPENSTGALRYAIEQGCEIVEIDPKPTADHVFILAHDADMKRQVYGPAPGGLVGSGASMNWYGQLENFTLRVSDNVNEDSGYRVCTLAEVFEICKDQCYVQMDINFWTANTWVNELWEMVKKYGMEEQCLFFSGNFKDGHPKDMIFLGDIGNGRGGAGTLNQNMAAPYNDASVGTHPERMGFQSLMDRYNPLNIMTDDSLGLRDYLEKVGRRNKDWAVVDDDTRRAVKVPWISAKSYVAGQKPKYGIKPTDDYEVVEDEGNGDPDHGEFYFVLKLKDPVNTRWANLDYTDPRSYRDGIKTVWYFADPIPAETVPAMPTDYVDNTPGVTKYGIDGEVGGLKWTGAARAYAIDDELVLIFGGDNLSGSLEVAAGRQPVGRYVLVGGGGPGGMNGNKGGRLPGAGGGAGGMLEGEFGGQEGVLNPGKYVVSVGKGGSPTWDHGKPNGRGEDTTLTAEGAEKALLTAFGGGGGAHASTGNNQKAAATGVSGGSSGGSLVFFNYGCNPAANDATWGLGAVRGQGNPGGRMGGYLSSAMANSSTGGGGASLEADKARGVWQGGTTNEWAITTGWGQKFDMIEGGDASKYMNKFTGGGQGRMSDITGSEVFYAGGGAGGGIYSADTRQPIYGGVGGGGSTIWTSAQIAGHGVSMLGGGGAGMSFRSAKDKFSAGRGGDGVAIFRIKVK